MQTKEIQKMNIQELSDIISSAERMNLSNICSVNPDSINDIEADSIKYLDIGSTNAGYYDSLDEYSLDEAPSRAKRGVNQDDTVISRVRPARGQYVYIQDPPENMVVSSGFVVLRPKEDVNLNSRYLYYATTAPYFINYLDSNATGSAYPSTNLTEVKKAEIPVPDLETQQIIADLLAPLEQKTTVNSRIATLCGKIPDDIFRNKFKTHLEVWRSQERTNQDVTIGTLGELADFVLGGTPDTDNESYWEGSIEWIKAGQVSNTRFDYTTGISDMISEKAVSESSVEMVPKDTTVIVARGATMGELALVPREMGINQTCYGLVPHSEDDRFFLYYLMKAIIRDLKSRSHGTVFDTVTKSTLKEQKIPIPEKSRRKEFDEVASAYLSMVSERIEENQKLRELLIDVKSELFNNR